MHPLIVLLCDLGVSLIASDRSVLRTISDSDLRLGDDLEHLARGRALAAFCPVCNHAWPVSKRSANQRTRTGNSGKRGPVIKVSSRHVTTIGGSIQDDGSNTDDGRVLRKTAVLCCQALDNLERN